MSTFSHITPLHYFPDFGPVHALVKNRFTNAGLKKNKYFEWLNSLKKYSTSPDLENKYCVKGGPLPGPPKII